MGLKPAAVKEPKNIFVCFLADDMLLVTSDKFTKKHFLTGNVGQTASVAAPK